MRTVTCWYPRKASTVMMESFTGPTATASELRRKNAIRASSGKPLVPAGSGKHRSYVFEHQSYLGLILNGPFE
jgi:hypothetical protein